ncbi:MAG: hypothetical protein JO337_11485 [Acidimicrobiales bacterium]|nr:hypothetical protein [Acidimicrobiales bacterium]
MTTNIMRLYEQETSLPLGVVASAIQTWEPTEAMKVVETLLTEHVSGHIKDDVTVLAITRI